MFGRRDVAALGDSYNELRRVQLPLPSPQFSGID
jgi:hypothetical protein